MKLLHFLDRLLRVTRLLKPCLANARCNAQSNETSMSLIWYLLNSIAFVSLAEFQLIAFNQCNGRFHFTSVGRRTDMSFVLGYASAC
jgi:hypothetical protein